ncbi:MAG: hypothetical protein ACRDST_08170 [Pseudonocardiaceae bacterium]
MPDELDRPSGRLLREDRGHRHHAYRPATGQAGADHHGFGYAVERGADGQREARSAALLRLLRSRPLPVSSAPAGQRDVGRTVDERTHHRAQDRRQQARTVRGFGDELEGHRR